MEIELKPCPFCGIKPVVCRQGNDRTRRTITVKCLGCRVQLTTSALRNTFEWLEHIAADTWNRRMEVK